MRGQPLCKVRFFLQSKTLQSYCIADHCAQQDKMGQCNMTVYQITVILCFKYDPMFLVVIYVISKHSWYFEWLINIGFIKIPIFLISFFM